LTFTDSFIDINHTGIGIIFALIAGATFTSSWVVGVAFGIAALIVFGFALKDFSNVISPKPQTIVPTIATLLLL
jgi:hypothetical protein